MQRFFKHVRVSSLTRLRYPITRSLHTRFVARGNGNPDRRHRRTTPSTLNTSLKAYSIHLPLLARERGISRARGGQAIRKCLRVRKCRKPDSKKASRKAKQGEEAIQDLPSLQTPLVQGIQPCQEPFARIANIT